MKILDLCAGIGGFSLAAHWAGWETAAFCEIDKFCQKVLAKNFPGVPIYDDLFTFPSESFRGRIDGLTAGFPCQPFSAAGKRKGREDERHIFPKIAEIVGIVRPSICIFENVRGLLSIESGAVFAEVVTSLESEGYEVITFCVPASAVEAPHRRDRLWIVGCRRDNGFDTAVGIKPVETQTDKWRESSQERHEIRQVNIASSRTGNATNPNNPRNGTPASEPNAKRPPLGVERQQSQLESDGHGSDVTDTRCKYGTGNGERMDIDKTERTASDIHTQRCDSESKDADGDDTNCTSERLERPAGQIIQGRVPRLTASLGWRENWTNVAARTCVRGMDDGVSLKLDITGARDNRVSRLKALGNAVVPIIPFEIFKAIEDAERQTSD